MVNDTQDQAVKSRIAALIAEGYDEADICMECGYHCDDHDMRGGHDEDLGCPPAPEARSMTETKTQHTPGHIFDSEQT